MINIAIIWKSEAHRGTIAANDATIVYPTDSFNTSKLAVQFADAALDAGGIPTIVNVRTDKDPFSFFLRDVHAENPIYIPAYEVVVTTAADQRSYGQIVADIQAKGGKTKLAQIQDEEEYNFAEAARQTRDLPGPAWLGVSKDMRFFEVGLRSKSCGNDNEQFDYVVPRFFMTSAKPPELNDREPRYSMMAGRGLGCKHEVTKRLEEGYMPILNAKNVDDGIVYHMQFFATLEQSRLDCDHLRGTDMYAADAYGAGHMFTPEQQKHVDEIIDKELHREEETVMFIRIVAENTLRAPAYSYVKLPDPIPWREYDKTAPKMLYDGKTGYTYFPETSRICAITTVDGKPAPQDEMVVLLAPGQKITYIIKIPHQPLAPERAEQLAETDYETKLAEAKNFWRHELAGAAQITLPEKRIEEMIKAGLLHMDVGYFGKNPDGPVVPIVGVYTAIGSESSPGIQFLDTMGMHNLAARALQFFVEKQHEDGFIQNFGGYMLETGSTLWTMGEHYRLTRDDAWVRSVQNCIVKASEYLISWREKNLSEELKGGKGYGMISGKIADPEDHFHSFMLNAGTYIGLSRAAEMLAVCDPERSRRYAAISSELRENIRESFKQSMAVSEVLPMGDGTWIPSFSPWTEYVGPVSIYAKGGKWYSHGIFNARDMTGAAYLVLQEVIAPEEPMADNIIKYYTEYLTLNNTAFSQSYYSPHPYLHARRGEVKPFLKEFYSGFAALADRETYSFWEHYFHASQHKLHEETWFLMRCRWLLCLEDYGRSELSLMSMAPRQWFEDGKTTEVSGMKTYFGTVSFKIESKTGVGRILADINVDPGQCPSARCVTIRLPHPDGKKARYVSEGRYCADTESVILDPFKGHTSLEVVF
ncbi:MAG: hypothetical protein VB070_14795 [Clostridiaceae bacterium]|nr:hypothetical protein [Clostridiaceae bacterium]